MAFSVPTTSDFTTLFEAFSDAPQALLDKALEIGQTHVDDSWCSQSDFELGIFYKMAEWLTNMGQGAGSSPVVAGDYRTWKSGEASFTRFTADELEGANGGTAGKPDWSQLYDDLLVKNGRAGPFTTAFVY